MGRGIVESGLFRSERLTLEERTSDPSNTQEGEAWIRTDINPDTDQLATLRFDNGSGTWDIPIYDTTATTDNVSKPLRFEVAGSTGFVPVTTSGGTYDALRLQHNDSTYAFHDALEASAIPDSGVARWKFEQDVTDSWYGHDGADNTSAGYVTGHVGEYAKDLDGADDYIEVAYDAALELDTFTIGGWINPDGSLAGTGAALGPCRWEGGASGINNYILFVTVNDELEGRFHDTNDNIHSVTYGTLPSAGVWTHVLFAYDGAQMRLYVDGSRVAENSVSATPKGGTFPVHIGVREEGGNGAKGWFDGQADDHRIYNKGLSDTEASNLYQTGSI